MNVYDEASRIKEVILPDGAKILTDYGASVSGIIGVTKQITDQAGKKRQGISDALGRMIRVKVLIAGMTQFVFEVTGDDGKPFEGAVTETVESKEFGQDKPTEINKAPVKLQNGQFGDYITGSDDLEGNYMPPDSDLQQAYNTVDQVKTRVEQTATFTVRSANTDATLTIVHKRLLTNLDSQGNLRTVQNGTRFVWYNLGVTVTPSQ